MQTVSFTPKKRSHTFAQQIVGRKRNQIACHSRDLDAFVVECRRVNPAVRHLLTYNGQKLMRKILTLLLILLLPRLLWGQTTATLPSPPVVLTHVTVIDIPRGRAKSEMTVRLEGEHIIALGRGRNIKVPQSAQVIDATGKYLIPGLWDMHVHEWNKEVFFPLFIANGLTGVRDMFSPLPFPKVFEVRC